MCQGLCDGITLAGDTLFFFFQLTIPSDRKSCIGLYLRTVHTHGKPRGGRERLCFFLPPTYMNQTVCEYSSTPLPYGYDLVGWYIMMKVTSKTFIHGTVEFYILVGYKYNVQSICCYCKINSDQDPIMKAHKLVSPLHGLFCDNDWLNVQYPTHLGLLTFFFI